MTEYTVFVRHCTLKANQRETVYTRKIKFFNNKKLCLLLSFIANLNLNSFYNLFLCDSTNRAYTHIKCH